MSELNETQKAVIGDAHRVFASRSASAYQAELDRDAAVDRYAEAAKLRCEAGRHFAEVLAREIGVFEDEDAYEGTWTVAVNGSVFRLTKRRHHSGNGDAALWVEQVPLAGVFRTTSKEGN